MSLMRHIPEIGEMGSADAVPAKVQVLHITAGSATTNDLVLSDTGIYTLVTVLEPIMVTKVWTQVNTGFTASVTLDIGDTDSLNRLMASTVIVPQSTGAVLVVSDAAAIATVPYRYAAAQNLTLDVEAAAVAAGQMDIFIEYVRLAD